MPNHVWGYWRIDKVGAAEMLESKLHIFPQEEIGASLSPGYSSRTFCGKRPNTHRTHAIDRATALKHPESICKTCAKIAGMHTDPKPLIEQVAPASTIADAFSHLAGALGKMGEEIGNAITQATAIAEALPLVYLLRHPNGSWLAIEHDGLCWVKDLGRQCFMTHLPMAKYYQTLYAGSEILTFRLLPHGETLHRQFSVVDFDQLAPEPMPEDREPLSPEDRIEQHLRQF